MKSQRLVVGVDGSKAARAALRWAVASAAEQDGDSIHAVAAWQQEGAASPSTRLRREREDKLLAMMAAEIAAIPADELAGTKITTEVSEGMPGDVLADACRDADLLVLGRQGHGAAWRMIFGSTSEACVRNVACPVVIVTPSPKAR